MKKTRLASRSRLTYNLEQLNASVPQKRGLVKKENERIEQLSSDNRAATKKTSGNKRHPH